MSEEEKSEQISDIMNFDAWLVYLDSDQRKKMINILFKSIDE